MKALRASSFGATAGSYAEHRPEYPDAAVNWALEPVRSRHPLRVLDLGAGTGRITEALQRAEVDVIAVEPDAGMRAEMLNRVYGVAVLAGTAEDIPLPDERVDAVVVGQAFHWFDQQRAMPEIARVLKPGGVLAAMWNTDDLRVPWVEKYTELSGFSRRPLGSGSELVDHPAFEPLEWASFDHGHVRTVDSLVATVATYSAVIVLPAAERAARLQLVRDYLLATPETASGEFELPLRTRVARAVRR